MILDSFQLHGKNALVTGSSRGMGAAIALALRAGRRQCRAAWFEVRSSRSDPDRCRDRRSSHAALDRRSYPAPQRRRRLLDQAIEALGSIDILVNNAGITRRAPPSTIPWRPGRSSRHKPHQPVSPVPMRSPPHARTRIRQDHQHGISLSFQGGITVPAYAAAKGAVAQLTKALANEWAARGVQVNAIAPGYMATDLTQALQDDSTSFPANPRTHPSRHAGVLRTTLQAPPFFSRLPRATT